MITWIKNKLGFKKKIKTKEQNLEYLINNLDRHYNFVMASNEIFLSTYLIKACRNIISTSVCLTEKEKEKITEFIKTVNLISNDKELTNIQKIQAYGNIYKELKTKEKGNKLICQIQ